MNLLPDPCDDRQKQVPCPPNKPLPESALFPSSGNLLTFY